MAKHDASRRQLLDWYGTLHARRVDLVGDYAGSELFLVEGDSLLLRCLSDPKLDFDGGFQLLHAVYAVEHFIQGLVQRKCNLHLVFFNEHEALCIPRKTPASNRHKYLLSRAILIRHFQVHLPESNPSIELHIFSSVQDHEFKEYLTSSGAYFMLCHDGADPTAFNEALSSHEEDNAEKAQLEEEDLSRKVAFRTMICSLINQGYNVALINGLEWMDTKVMTMVIERARRTRFEPEVSLEESELPSSRDLELEDTVTSLLMKLGLQLGEKAGDETEQSISKLNLKNPESIALRVSNVVGSSERVYLTLVSLASILENDTFKHSPALTLAFIMHMIVIGDTRISARSQAQRLEENEENVEIQDFLARFTAISRYILNKNFWSIAMENQAATCDIADLVDGRLFAVVFSHVMNPLDRNVINYPRLDTKLHELISILQLICGDRIKFGFPRTPSDVSVKVMPYAEVDQIKILPFSNAIFDKHLASIEISIDRSTIQNRQTARIFQEVSHWHNSKRKIDTKTLPPLTNWEKSRALRRNQFFMAEMQAYAASLTNAAGKILEPEIVTLADPKKASKILTESKQDSEESSGSKKVNKARGGSGRKGGGKKQMYESIAAKQAVKGNESAEKLFSSWQTVQKGLDSERSLSSKYIKTKAYLRNLADEKRAVLQPEVEFYLLTVLMDIYRILCGRKTENNVLRGEEFYGVAALIWDTILRLNPSHGLTTIMSENIKLISETLGLPLIELPAAVTDRPLSFKPNLSFLNIKDMSIPLDPIEFQCLHCGPYMDRNLDSAFDPRVPFRPDGWQRQVLDELDANRSVFVVAPTSAGKTFISFYAMEKILKADDDSVLVYVAPTKALVNQIAAEIQARYKKTYRYSKSVWAIHTRDYRINNPSGCQILVTVPHILQIMLLSPDNAKSWSKKVKTIIFDEIHSIGNAEDGVVWEQLLLLAPCPIIALSATVGNPEQFNSWLASTQKSAGFELKMIQHPYRYSDLRKFVYRPPERFAFYGLPEKASFAVLGLDGLEHFSFIHPIASLVNKSRGMPDDLSLEPRDCLTLWQAMVRHQNKDFPVNKSLSPGENVLSRIIRKVDIIKWEKSLKELLRAWMRNNQSPFDKVVEDLSMPLHDSSHPTIQVSSRHEVDSGSGEMVRIDADNLLDTTLPLLCKLHERDALPVILFNYDRNKCEQICSSIISQLTSSEARWKSKSPAWTKKLKDWEQWKLDQTKLAGKRIPKNIPKKKGKGDEDDVFSKADRIQEAASSEASPFASFDPHAPIDGFHFAVKHRAESSELDHHIWHLKRRGVAGWLIDALTRGIGVHHAGMNRKYRQVVEMLFRKGYLRVVIATGTLALGINMPCATVVFSGDSVFLTALNFRQAAGRAGRRGFDLLGNVVFQNINDSKVCRLISSRLPDLNGHFPITTTLVLRLFTLLHESGNSPYAVQAIDSLLSQPRLYLDGLAFKDQVLHHLRFSIEYLRRQDLLSSQGAPLNFAGLTSHLYYTENSSFAINALLKGGFFHELCSDINDKSSSVTRSLMVVMAHLFGRRPCRQADQEYIDNIIKRSPSIVFLPQLPSRAAHILRQHNQDTLLVFTNYVQTFVDQHLRSDDCMLPLTKKKVGGKETIKRLDVNVPETKVRSPFVALSGHGDKFDSISDLCRTTREGIFLEEAVIPHLDVYPDEAKTPLNAYLYDFFMHGDLNALEQANGVRKSDAWFLLNDFSMVLATIITSLANFLKISNSDVDLIDVMGEGDEHTNLEDDMFAIDFSSEKSDATTSGASSTQDRIPLPSTSTSNPRFKKKVAESWDDAALDDDAGSPSDTSGDEEGSIGGAKDRSVEEIERGFINIYKALSMLRLEFDTKFKKIFA